MDSQPSVSALNMEIDSEKATDRKPPDLSSPTNFETKVMDKLNATTSVQIAVDQPEEEEEEKDEIDDEEAQLVLTGSNYATVGKKSFLGNTCTLKTLLDDQVLMPEEGSLSFEFMGKGFVADLMPNGNIRWMETKQMFTTPSGWVNHCKKTMTAENINKTVSAWSIIKYRGKRLDSYKLRWYRMKKKSLAEQNGSVVNSQGNQPNFAGNNANSSFGSNGFNGQFGNGAFNANNSSASNHNFNSNLLMDGQVKSNTELLNSINPGLAALYNEATKSTLSCDEDPALLRQHQVIEHTELPKKYVFNDSEIQYLDCNQLIRAIPFRALDRIQPFTITVSSNALLLMDYHCHLTDSEVVGYLAGNWDVGNHTLSILQAFPCRARLDDAIKSKIVEEEIRQSLRQRNLSLVGWYHNHADKPAQPSIKDIECQLEYQVTMKGNECDLAYIPCVGFICSPYYEYNRDQLSSFLAYWVMPPSELTSLEYGKPMQMFYQITRDSFLTQDLLLEMRLLAHFYIGKEYAINFKSTYSSRKLKIEEDKTIEEEVKEEVESILNGNTEETLIISKIKEETDLTDKPSVDNPDENESEVSVKDTQPEGKILSDARDVTIENEKCIKDEPEDEKEDKKGGEQEDESKEEKELENEKEKKENQEEKRKEEEDKEEPMEMDEKPAEQKPNGSKELVNGKEEEEEKLETDLREEIEKDAECSSLNGKTSFTYWEKLKFSLQPNLPKDLQFVESMEKQQIQLQQQALSHFYAFLKGLLLNLNTEAAAEKRAE